jgi:hypothetical protein
VKREKNEVKMAAEVGMEGASLKIQNTKNNQCHQTELNKRAFF